MPHANDQDPGQVTSSRLHSLPNPQGSLICHKSKGFIPELRLLNSSWLVFQNGIKGRTWISSAHFLFFGIYIFQHNLYFCSTRIIGFGDCYLGWIEAHRIYFVRNCVKMCFQFALPAPNQCRTERRGKEVNIARVSGKRVRAGLNPGSLDS